MPKFMIPSSDVSIITGLYILVLFGVTIAALVIVTLRPEPLTKSDLRILVLLEKTK